MDKERRQFIEKLIALGHTDNKKTTDKETEPRANNITKIGDINYNITKAAGSNPGGNVPKSVSLDKDYISRFKADGSEYVSTFIVDDNNKKVVIPGYADGKTLTYTEAEKRYRETGESFGKFDTAREAAQLVNQINSDGPQLVSSESVPVNIGDWISSNAKAGLVQVGKGAAATANFVNELVMPKKYEDNFVSKFNDYVTKEYEKETQLANMEAHNKAGYKWGGDVIKAAVAAVPTVFLAYATAGSNLAATGTVKGASAASKVVSFAKNMIKNPTYWSSFLQTVGTDYEEAKSQGANDFMASSAAIITSLLNAGVEVGGGTEKLVQNAAKQGKKATWKMVWDWLKSSGEEGGEEVVQGLITKGMAKLIYDKDKEVFSTTNSDAIINPAESAKEFSIGATVGGLLGGGQTLGSATISRYNTTQIGKEFQEFQREIIETGLDSPEDTEAYRNAEKLSGKKNVSNYNLGRQYLLNVEQIESEQSTSEQHTPEMQKIISDYENAVDKKMLSFISEARNNPDNNATYRLSNVSDKLAKDIKKLTGINVIGFGNSIKSSSIKHIDKRHGINGKNDSSMADSNDIARMQYVISNYDNIELLPDGSNEYRDKNQHKAPMVKLSKRIDGTYYVVEAVPDTKKHELAIVSVYKNKATNVQTVDVQAPTSDVRNASADVAFNQNINSAPNDNTVPQMYVQDVKNNAPGTIIPQDNNGVNSNIRSEDNKNAGNSEYIGFVNRLKASLQKLRTSEKIFDIDEKHIKRKNKPSLTIIEYFNSIGNKAVNPVLGEVELTKRGAKSTTFHGISNDKTTAILAVKNVIEKGEIIAHDANWKTRGYDTYIIAGRGDVNGNESIVGVIVKNFPQGNMNNKFYLHEVIKIGVNPDAAVIKDVTDVNGSTPTDTIISQKNKDVNSNIRKDGIKNASNSLKAVESTLINNSVSDEIRQSIINSATAIEQSLPEGKKSIKTVVDGATKFTSNISKMFESFVGNIQNPYALLDTNLKAMRKTDSSIITSNFVQAYAEIYVNALKGNNAKEYGNIEPAGEDAATALTNYILNGTAPGTVKNYGSFVDAAANIKRIISGTATALRVSHKELYGNNPVVDAQLKSIADGNFSGITTTTENVLTAGESDSAGRNITDSINVMDNTSNVQLIEDYERAVDDIVSVDDETARKYAENRVAVEVSESTPDVILDNVEDAKNLKVIINYNKLYLAVRKNGVFKGHYHNLGTEIAKKLPDFLQSPDAIIQLANGRLNLFATVKTETGSNGIISVELNSTKDIGGKNEDYSVVVTMFSSGDSYAQNLISGDGVVVKYRREDLSQVNPQLYKWLATINDKSSTDTIISQKNDDVNSSIRSKTEKDVQKGVLTPSENSGTINNTEAKSEKVSITDVENTSRESLPRTADDFIDNRTNKEVGNRKVKAFQYLEPQFKSFYTPIAQELIGDIHSTIKGERFMVGDGEWTGTTRQTSETIAHIKDEFNVTYAEIEDALNRLINDEGQENTALAKRIELVIDDMLTEGYTNFYGNEIPPDEMYIAGKAATVATVPEYQTDELKRQYLGEMAENETKIVYSVDKTPKTERVVPYTEKEKKNWKKSDSIIVYESDEQFESFIEKVLNNEDTHKKIYFGKVPDSTAQMVLDKTGIDVAGHNIALKGYEIRKILLNSHGDAAQEAARGQEPIMAEDLKNIPSVITNPDNVTLSDKEYEGKPALLFEKNIDGKNYVVAYVSRKHHDIAIQTMYKKRSLATAENADAFSSTSETTSSTASNISISQNNTDVNTYDMQNSEKYSVEIENNDLYNSTDLIFKSPDYVEENLAKQIDKWLKGEMRSYESFEFGDTPVVLQVLGSKELPVMMNQSVLAKITGEKHSISLDEIKRIPGAIADPIMVFKSNTVDNAFVVLTELTDKNGNDIVVALHLNKAEKHIRINRIASVYGKDNIVNFVNIQTKNGNLKYIDKIKSQEWSQSRGLQLPKLADTNPDNNIILQKDDIVNTYDMQNSKKYSSESEDNNERGNLLSDGSGKRQNGASTEVTASVMAESTGRTQKEKRDARQRISLCDELKKSGKTKRRIIAGHRCEVIQSEHYNDRMRAIEEKNGANGFDETIIVTGGVELPFMKDENGNPKTARGVFVETADGRKIAIVRYDHEYFTPEQINEHEGVHKNYKTSRVQKARNIIWNSISVSERNKILNAVAEDYEGISTDKKEYLIEEFVANTLAGMNEYSQRFAELVSDYQSGGEILDVYKVSEYTESIDAGGLNKVKITMADVRAVQSIPRKSVNDFTSEDISKTENFARKYFEEIGVKSPFFRAWFGDWRANDMTPVHIVTEKGSVRGVTNNKDTGWDIQVSGKVFNETGHKATKNQRAMPYLDYINSIVENAILLDSFSMDNKKSENSAMMHSFYAVADMGNGNELIKLYVEELNDVSSNGTIKRSYQLQNLNKIPLESSGFSKNSLAPSDQRYEYTISQLFELVKSVDKNFNPKPVSNVVNEDGTPKVVYHGTADEFYIFDKKMFGKNTGAASSRKGIFLTDSYSVATGYAEDARPDNINRLYKEAERLENRAFYNGDYSVAERAWEEYERAELEYGGNGRIIDSYVSIKNPLIYDFKGAEYREKTYNDLIQTAIKNRNDGVILKNTYDGSNKAHDELCTVYCVFDSSQIKSATDNIGTFDGNNPDIRYALDENGFWDLEHIFEDDDVISADDIQKKWSGKIDEYGAIEKGENPSRDIDVPKKITEDKLVSRFARTMLEAGVTPEWAVSEFEKRILDGDMTHEVITNDRAREVAERDIRELGFEGALVRWNELSEAGKVGKNELAFGMELYNQCINNKDTKNAMKIAADLAAEATRAGQTVQACRLLKLMNPDGQLYYLEKSIRKMNEEFRNKIGERYKDIELDEELVDDFLKAETEEARNATYDKICQSVADQIPATFRDKWDSWRYLAMLGNPRTHIRNIAGNAVFVPVIRIKNFLGAALESVAVKDSERTKSVTKNKKAVEFAKEDFKFMVKTLQGENAKYAITSDIEGKRTIFKTKWLEKLRVKNFEFLENEDMWFLKLHYVDALARIITARKLDVESIDSRTLDTIRAYAVKEAQAATYRDANVLAEAFTKVQRKLDRSDNKIIRSAGILTEGMMPFKKTPLNIAKQGVAYSPVSIMTGTYKLLKNLKTGKYSTADIVDEFAKGLTGSMIMLLGLFFAKMGWLDGGDDENAKKKNFDKMVGEQSYSINAFGSSYTIDWMTPTSLPLFVGAELNKLTEQDGYGFREVVGAMAALPNPLLELSVFSGVSDTIASAQYNQSNEVTAVISDMTISYFMQALPTVGGQISRIIDNKKRNYYYTDKNKDIPDSIQKIIGQASSKIPFVSYLFEPSVDSWGREETYGSLPERITENVVSPGYYSQEDYASVDKEIARLYEKTGEADVLPTSQGKYYTENGTKYNMTARHYTEVKKIRGQESFKLVKELISSSNYNAMNDEEKVKAINKCYKKAGEIAKEKMLDKIKKASKK